MMKRHLTATVVESEGGHVGYALTLQQECNGELVHQAFEIRRTDSEAPPSTAEWLSLCASVIQAALVAPGDSGKQLLATMEEGRNECPVRH